MNFDNYLFTRNYIYNERAVNNTTNERAGWLVQHVWICARVTKAILAVCRAGFAGVIAWES